MNKMEIDNEKLLNLEVSKRIKKRLNLAYSYRQRNSKESWNQAQHAYTEAKDGKFNELELESLYHLCLTSMYYDKVQNPLIYIEKLSRKGFDLNKSAYIGRSYIFRYRLEKKVIY